MTSENATIPDDDDADSDNVSVTEGPQYVPLLSHQQYYIYFNCVVLFKDENVTVKKETIRQNDKQIKGIRIA